VEGFSTSVEKISRADIAKFHAAYWRPGSSALIFAGDISLDDALALSKQYFGSWSGGSAPPVTIPPAAPLTPGKIYLIDRPDAAQTVLSEILPAPTRALPDYYSFSLADAVWGGTVGARLGTNLREEKGYSYGVDSFPHFYSKAGVWVASGGVQTNKTKESVVEFQKELHFLAGQKPVTETELKAAKDARIRSYAQSFESLRRVNTKILDFWSLGMPLSDLQREPGELEKVTLTSVNATAEKYANPGKAMLLMVGDAAKIKADVQGLNLGEVVMLDKEGRPLINKP